jgi:lysophospholipase L1-like esterase
MELKTFFAQDLSGNVIPSPSVNVYQPGTTTRVTGLQTATGAALSNPFTGTSTGQITFAAPDGTYDLAISGSGRAITMRVRFVDVTADGVALAEAAAAGASGSAAASEAAKIASEAARDAINTTGKVFTAEEGTAAGIAATTDGQQFAVLSADNTYWTIYRNDSGTALAVGPGNYTKAHIDTFGIERVADEQEPIFSVVDEDGKRTWIESNIDGAPTVHAAGKIGSVLGPENTPGLAGFEEIDESLNDISFGIVDSAGRRTWVEAKLDGKPTARAAEVMLEAQGWKDADDDLNALSLAFVDENNKRTWLEANLEGAPTRRSAMLIAAAMLSTGYLPVAAAYKSSYQDQEFKVSSGPDIWCIGDSMTAGAGGGGTTYPIVLQSLLTADGHTGVVRNGGVGGETSVTITARTGAYPFIVNVTGGSIPASGGVAITFRSINGQPTQPLLQGSTSMVGMLGDLPGTISQSGGTYTFTRTTAGTSIVADRPLAFYRDDNKLRRGDIAIIWIGQNGPSNTRAIEDARAIVQYLTALDKRFLVISKPGGTSSADTDDAAWFAAFGRRFLPVRQYMVEFGLQDAGITPTSQDLTDIAAGTVPTSLRVDSVHWTAAGYTILGNLLFNRLTEMGWV